MSAISPSITRNVATWRSTVLHAIRESGYRRDLASTLTGIVEVLAREWRPSTATSSPGHDVIAARIGRSESTVTRGIGRLQEMGVLSVSSAGTIVWGEEGVRQRMRAEYLLLDVPKGGQRGAAGVERWPLHKSPRSKRDRRAAAAAMQRVARDWLGRTSSADVASVCRPFFVAGWTPRDILSALDSRPDDSRWTFTTPPRRVSSWMRFRLSHWLQPDWTPMASPRQVAEQRRASVIAAQLEARKVWEEDRARRAAGPDEGTLSAMAQARAAVRRGAARFKQVSGSRRASENADPLRPTSYEVSPLARASKERSDKAPQRGARTHRPPRHWKAVLADHGAVVPSGQTLEGHDSDEMRFDHQG